MLKFVRHINWPSRMLMIHTLHHAARRARRGSSPMAGGSVNTAGLLVVESDFARPSAPSGTVTATHSGDFRAGARGARPGEVLAPAATVASPT